MRLMGLFGAALLGSVMAMPSAGVVASSNESEVTAVKKRTAKKPVRAKLVKPAATQKVTITDAAGQSVAPAASTSAVGAVAGSTATGEQTVTVTSPAPVQVAQAPDAAKLAQTCAACHGADGNAVMADTPILAGQTMRYLYLQLKDFKEGRRENPLMSPLAKNLTKEEMLALAQFYAAQKQKPTDFKADGTKVVKGKAKADEVLCTMCHLGGFSGQNEIPKVAGQRYDYIVKQLKDFKAMKRTNDAGNMTSVSKTLSDEDIENLAHYIASL